MLKTVAYGSLLFATTLLAGCQVIGGIFKAGVWAGVLLVVAALAVIFYIVRTMTKK